MRQRDVPAEQRKRPSRGRRAEAHSGGGELSREADGAVMDIDVPSVKNSKNKLSIMEGILLDTCQLITAH